MRICGMDEVGRGALAGPLMAAASILNTQCSIIYMKDSKKLSKSQRERIYKELMDAKIEYVVEEISVETINEKGIGWANKELFRRLKNKLIADVYIADGNLKIEGINSEVKADNKYPEVMAASIIAKVKRDSHMRELHNLQMVYGWETNVGYGTKKHIEALRKYGMTKHHRVRFVETALKPHPLIPSPKLRRGKRIGRS